MGIGGEYMIDYTSYRIIELSEGQNRKDIETKIISILKEQKLSLSQVRSVFNNILVKIEDMNPIVL